MICPKCEHQNSHDDLICSRCMAIIERPKESNNGKTGVFVYLNVAFVLLISSLALAALLINPQKTEPTVQISSEASSVTNLESDRAKFAEAFKHVTEFETEYFELKRQFDEGFGKIIDSDNRNSAEMKRIRKLMKGAVKKIGELSDNEQNYVAPSLSDNEAGRHLSAAVSMHKEVVKANNSVIIAIYEADLRGAEDTSDAAKKFAAESAKSWLLGFRALDLPIPKLKKNTSTSQ